MFNKIQNWLKNSRLRQLRDVRAVGLMVFGVVVLLVSWSGVKVIQSNYELQKKIARLEQENAVQQLSNENLELRNQYLKTDEYLELSARRQFGKGAPGETLVLVPKNVALKYTVDIPEPDEPKPVSVVNKPSYQKNFEAWMNFFLHRDQVIE